MSDKDPSGPPQSEDLSIRDVSPRARRVIGQFVTDDEPGQNRPAFPRQRKQLQIRRELTRKLEQKEEQREQEYKAARTDELTGLPNRRSLREQYELARARFLHPNKRHTDPEQPGYILFIDLDNFGAINKTRGDYWGDEALRRVAGTMRLTFRQEDVMGRLGGDEFISILLGEPKEVAVSKATELGLRIPSDSGLTASIGVAALDFSNPFETFFTEADELMRQAKEKGRNQVVVLDDPTSDPPL